MDAIQAILFKYPTASPSHDFKVRNDGNGQYLDQWNLTDPRPTDADLQQWWDESQIKFTLTSATATPNEYTITATLNNPPSPAPTSVTFTIAGTIFTETLTNNQASITVDLHKVIASQSIPVQVSADGCVSGTINIGGTSTASSHLKAVTQTNGNVLVKCISKLEVTAYYMAHTVSQSDILTDLANLIDLHSDMLNKLMTQAQGASYAPLTLSTDEVHAFQDFTANYVDKLRLKLADASPATGSTTAQNPRYPNIISHKEQANTNADEYLQVVSDPDVV